MEQTDKIAILLATYNGEKYLAEQLESILAQTETEWVVYLHDDGSTDRTRNIIREYVVSYPSRFRYIDGASTGGAKNNFFYLLSQVEARYYMFCDQDDVWKEQKIEWTLERMRAVEPDNAPALVFTELQVVDEQLQTISGSMSSFQSLDCTKTRINRLMMQNVITGCTVMINRTLRDQMLLVQHMDNIIMHDWWAGLIASLYGSISFVEEPTILYRQHHANSVGAIDAHDKKYILEKAKAADKIRQSLKDTKTQTGELVEVFGLPADSLCARYARSDAWKKLRRLFFYWKNDIKKTNWMRNVGLILWG
jgi:glycosyltransferase involved in cell wall biosynthesis